MIIWGRSPWHPRLSNIILDLHFVQVGPVGRNVPKVCIWEPCAGQQPEASQGASMPQKFLLEFPKADRGITAVAFSPCGNRIATVAMDNSHIMYIWNIGKGAKAVQRQGEDRGDALAWCKTANGAPPAVRPRPPPPPPPPLLLFLLRC